MRDPASSSSSLPNSHEAVRRALDQFHALQTAMHDTYNSLPPDAQAAILRRTPQPQLPQPTPPSASAATTYLTRRDAQGRMQASSGSSNGSSRDSQGSDNRPSTQSWTNPGHSSSSRPSSSSSQLQPPETVSPRSHSPSPPVPLHRVYVLNCKSCGTFLSDRGMRAVLLLKPNIILFSTDASPCNAGPLWPEKVRGAGPERTCDCLTSSLACHGCGSTVGYHIVQPCARCTASVQKHQRSANHHRYVFHHNEVSYEERRHWPGEDGVFGAAYQPGLSSRSTSTAPPSPAPSSSSSSFEPEPDTKDGPHRVARERSQVRPRTPTPECTLKYGDVLYWHNLVSGGERSKPIDPASRPVRVEERPGR